jgi:hypothetical protein
MDEGLAQEKRQAGPEDEQRNPYGDVIDSGQIADQPVEQR